MNFEKSYGVVDPMRLAKWFEHEDGGSFLIAPYGNPKQLEENIKLMKVGDDPATKLEETIYDAKKTSCEIIAKAILMDWKEVNDNDDKEMKYDADKGANVLYNYDDFRDWVVEHSNKLLTEQEEKKEAIVKN